MSSSLACNRESPEAAHQTREAELPLMEAIEELFADPQVTSAIGALLNEQAALCPSTEEGVEAATNDVRAHELYAGYKQYQQLVERILEMIATHIGVSAESIATACWEEMEQCAGAPSQYMCTEYITAALQYDAFLDLLNETARMDSYVTTAEPEDSNASAAHATESAQ